MAAVSIGYDAAAAETDDDDAWPWSIAKGKGRRRVGVGVCRSIFQKIGTSRDQLQMNGHVQRTTALLTFGIRRGDEE